MVQGGDCKVMSDIALSGFKPFEEGHRQNIQKAQSSLRPRNRESDDEAMCDKKR
jgi:hypothetical protein